MTIIYNQAKYRLYRKMLRKNGTVAEWMLWQRLKNKQLGARFRRQYSIGYYIADFCSPRKKLVIELDGGVHDDEGARYYDKERQETIEEMGFKILRFRNEEVEKDIENVVNKIKTFI